VANSDEMFHLKKCEFCRGKDGKEKDIYDNFQLAYDTAKFIEKEREIYLNVYKCPYGNGWHLTKNNASSEIIERKDTLFQNNDIPIRSSNGLWEYIKDESYDNSLFNEDDFERIVVPKNKDNQQLEPIVKIDCEQETNIIIVSGKVMEIVENIDIEKLFKINIQNVFCANMIKNILDGIIDQITIYNKNEDKIQFESYTILTKRDLIKNHKVKKGSFIKIKIFGKTINNINKWCCSKIY
jgi:hypothetical protein